MITLDDLKKLGGMVFPGMEPDLVRLLYAWAMCDPNEELQRLLAGSGISKKDMQVILEVFIPVPDAADRELLKACILTYQPDIKAAHILKTLCENPGHRITQAFINAGLDRILLAGRIQVQLEQPEAPPAFGSAQTTKEQQIILNYGRDLTALALTGAFVDLCDRPQELERIYQVLLRRNKANVALTGPAGVGKTALVELLAAKMARNDVPALLKNTRLFEIGMGKLVAGTMYRGDFEARLEQVLGAVLCSQPAILFIDEMHLICGAGRAEGVLTDASNLLKPYLARGDLKVIGATTVSEYLRYITQDAALDRRFQEIRLAIPDKATTMAMMRRQASSLAQHHQVRIGEAEVLRAVELTDRCMPSRVQPDKGVDLLDSAAGMAHRKGKSVLDGDDLLQSLAAMVDLPAEMLPEGSAYHLKDLAPRLKQRIIGQDLALERITATIAQRWKGLGNPDRNIGTFLLAGDTGVGKTETARALAEVLYGTPRALLHLDLGEYSQYGSVNKLIGVPAGYAGHDKDGVLTGWVREQGRGVILFDEIEKAHPDVYHLILGLLDNGRLTSAGGEHLDTRQCVVFLTTNALTPRELRPACIGFKAEWKAPDAHSLLERHFPREFLGRLDDIILFNSLGREDLRRIVELRLEEAVLNLREHDVELEYDKWTLIDYLCSQVQGLKAGARGIARLLEQRLMQPVALALLQDTTPGRKRFIIDERFYAGGKPVLMEQSTFAWQ